MRVGDVVTFQKKRWFVTMTKPGKLCVLRTWEGAQTEVPEVADKDEASGITLVAEAWRWPFIVTPMRAKAGPIVKVTLARGEHPLELEPLVDWVPSSVDRPGGPIYFSPLLRLQIGEVLVAGYKSGKLVRLAVNTGFASLPQRQRRAWEALQAPIRPTVYDRLMKPDDDYDEFEDT